MFCPATLPSRWVAYRAEELGGSARADTTDVVKQQLQVHYLPIWKQLLHGKEDVAQAAPDLGLRIFVLVKVERVRAPIP
jgi:hypothetical protein